MPKKELTIKDTSMYKGEVAEIHAELSSVERELKKTDRTYGDNLMIRARVEKVKEKVEWLESLIKKTSVGKK